MGSPGHIILILPKAIFILESIGKMDTKLYVGNLSYDTTEQELRTMFAEAGTVETVDLIKDRQTGESKGFAFITMSNQVEAEKAISLFNAKDVNHRPLKVNKARPKEERPMGRGGYDRN
jgi:cold-inducible RNA-binding protein